MARKPGVAAPPAMAPPAEAEAVIAAPALPVSGVAERDFGLPYRGGFLHWHAGARVCPDRWLAAHLVRHGAPVAWE